MVDMTGFWVVLVEANAAAECLLRIPPKRKETPLNIMAIARATAGIPQPPTKAPHMTSITIVRNLYRPLCLWRNLHDFPITTCQQICKCSASARMNTHITPHHPPAKRKAPESAQVVLLFIPCGVISLAH